MYSVTRLLAAGVIALMPLSSMAATVKASGYAEGAAGNRTLNSTFNSVASVVFETKAAGKLSSFTFWIDVTSNFFNTGEDLVLTLLGKHLTTLPTPTDEIASTTISAASLLAAPQIIGGDGGTYVAATWDMLSLDIDAALDEQFAVRHFPSGPNGQIKANGNDCTLALSIACSSPEIARFQGTQTTLGTGSNRFGMAFEVFVDDQMVDPPAVPLPAGLPLMIAGLGAFAVIRRKS